MALSTNLINNELLNQYVLQIKKNNTLSSKNTETSVNQEDKQESAFRTLLIQMMNSSSSSGNSMMAEFMTTALSNQESFGLENSLGATSDFNLNMRNAASSLSGDTSQGIDEYSSLGSTSAKYESNANPGTISNAPGDIGGKSYGAWQFSSKTGSLDSFINSLNQSNKVFYSKLTEAKTKDGDNFGENFDIAWTSISSHNREEFLKLQKNSIKQNYYDIAALALKSKYGFDINTKSNALKESLLSTAVQHGVGGTLSVFSKLNLNKSDGNIINDLYNERQKVNLYFKDSSAAVKQSVYNRFTREKQDMLSMFNSNSEEKFLTSV